MFRSVSGSREPLGGGGSASRKTCISTTAAGPDPGVHRSSPWSGVMRLNLGDYPPEAQSAQHREWLPACCSCLSGREEGAVSLVPKGEEQSWRNHPEHTNPRPLGPQDVANARYQLQELRNMSKARPTFTCPGLNYPHLSRPVGPKVTNQPANLPTCQPGSRMRRRLAKKKGGGRPRCNIVCPVIHPAHSRPQFAGVRYVPSWAGRKVEVGQLFSRLEGTDALPVLITPYSQSSIELCRNNKAGVGASGA